MTAKGVSPIPITAPRESDDELLRHSHVVCGTDFTDAGRDAADVAAELARAWGEPLALVHVVNEPERDSLPGQLRDSLALFERKQLGDERQRLTARGTTVVQCLRSGAPDQALMEEAQASLTRLLVLSCGQRKAGSRLLGKVVEQVAESSPVPTLVVRQGAPLLAWLSQRRALRVFVAADLSSASEAAIKWALELRRLGRCEFTIAHIENSPIAPFRIDAPITSAVASTISQMQTAARRYFREYVKKIVRGEQARIRVVSGWGHSDAHLIHLAQKQRADLIVTGRNQHRGLERMLHHSVSRGLLHYAPMNIGVVPAPADKG
jgi:nucleotide-binding universal stress UspA family protein